MLYLINPKQFIIIKNQNNILILINSSQFINQLLNLIYLDKIVRIFKKILQCKILSYNKMYQIIKESQL